MSIAQKLRGLVGQRLLANTAGFKVVRASGKNGPWIDEGESLALVPDGLQEVQFPMDVMGSDSIAATAQISVLFTYADNAVSMFNFAYSVDTSSHSGNFADATKKAVTNVIAPKVAEVLRAKPIAEMVKEITFPVTDCEGVMIKSIGLVVKPKDSAVLAALGAEKSQELIRAGKSAEQKTREAAIDHGAALRVKEHAEALKATDDAAHLIAEVAKNELAKAISSAAASTKLAEQQAAAASGMVASFKGDQMAYALWQLATAGGDVTVTTELLAALRGTKVSTQ